MEKAISRLKYLPFYALSILPMSALYLFSDGLYILAYYVIGYRRKVVRGNLENAFPKKEKKEIIGIEKKFYRHFCDVAVEAIKTLTISEKEVKKRLVVRNPEMLYQFLNDHQSILMYTAHQGNWEWLVYLPVYLKYPAYTFYRPLQNRYFNNLILIIRERFGVNCVDARKGYRTVLNQKRDKLPVINCVIGDQSPSGRDKKKWIRFFNKDTAFFVGAEKIAEKTSAAVLFPCFIKVKRGRYELQFEEVEKKWAKDRTFSIINGYAALLEEAISNHPELWLWSHRRWKLNPPTTWREETLTKESERKIS